MNLIKIKYTAVILIATSVLFSCQKEDMIVDIVTDPIEFKTSVAHIESVVTKSTLVENNLPDGASFGVLGYCVPFSLGTTPPTPDPVGAVGLWDVKRYNSYPDIFYKQKVTYQGGMCSYDYSGTLAYADNTDGPRGWETITENNSNRAKYTYTFFAYYPYDNGWTVNTNNNTLDAPNFTFTMPFNQNNINANLYDSDIPDAMVASIKDRIRADGAIPLQFTHILTGVNLKFVNYDSRKITITSATLSGTFYKEVNVDFKTDTYNVLETSTYNGSFIFNNGDHEIPSNASINLNNSKTVLLIPSNGIGSNVKLNIIYRIDGISGTSSHSIALTSSIFAPQPGFNYTLTLSFVSGAITLSIDSEIQWEDGGDSTSTIK